MAKKELPIIINDIDPLYIKAKEFIERVMPEPAYRNSVMKAFAETIAFINSRNKNSWSINFAKYGPFINIEHEICLYPGSNQNEYEFHVYFKSLSEQARAQLNQEAKVKEDPKDEWSTIRLRLPEQEGLILVLWPAFEAYIKDKALHNIFPTSIPPHAEKGAGVVEYIRRQGIDPNIQQPEYIRIMTTSSRSGDFNYSQNPIDQSLSVESLVDYFANCGLSFTPWQIVTFYTALQTKGFVILSGISGMGKTKIAQAFARLLPQPTVRYVLPSDLIRINVQPYMLKYNRIVVPKAAVEFFTPPDAGESILVDLLYSNQSVTCLFKHYKYDNTDYLQINLKGKAVDWFKKNFNREDTIDPIIILEPLLDGDDKLVGFRMGKLEEFSEQVRIKDNETLENYLFLSVRPDWKDNKSLLGYFNPLEQQYQSTLFLEFLMKARESFIKGENLAWFVVLDEMNLARVEYYFADLLSVMESGRDEDGWSRESIHLDYPGNMEIPLQEREIHLPPNLYVIGTVNVDETTHSFSPKVLDRAFTFELTEADFSNYPPSSSSNSTVISDEWRELVLKSFTRYGSYAQIEKSEIEKYLILDPGLRIKLENLYQLLKPYDLHFGYRVFDEIAQFLSNAQANELYDTPELTGDPLDTAVLMKILPKFHGSRSKLEEPLKAVLSWCINAENPDLSQIETVIQNGNNSVNGMIQALGTLSYQFPYTANRVIRMLRSLYSTGFASFG